MIVVLDASAAIEIVLQHADAKKFEKTLKEAELIIAPDIYVSEIVNTFWKYNSFSDLAATLCHEGIECCINLVDDFILSTNISKEVFSESVKCNHPAYDLFYAVVARRHDAILLTKDKKLRKMAKKMGIRLL